MELVIWAGVGLLIGYLTGRWWVVPVAFLLVVALIVLGERVNPCDETEPGVICDVNWTALAFFYYGPFTAATVAAGVFLRKLASGTWKRSRPDPSP